MEHATYSPVSLEKAYTLLNGGGLLWICTKGKEGRYDVAPIAWTCPLDYEPVTRLLFVSDPGHATFENMVQQGNTSTAPAKRFKGERI